MSNSVQPHRQQPTWLPRPWDSPGKNTGLGCHFLLQCRKVKSEREVAQSCPTLRDPMDCSLPGSSIHGIFQARVLEWSAIAFSLDDARTSVLGNWIYGNALNWCKEHRRNIPRESEWGAPFATCWFWGASMLFKKRWPMITYRNSSGIQKIALG